MARSSAVRTDEMPKTNTGDDKKRGGPTQPPMERTGERSSPGSGEDEEVNGVADLQPDEVEDGDTAR
jgi:hypothetical protein